MKRKNVHAKTALGRHRQQTGTLFLFYVLLFCFFTTRQQRSQSQRLAPSYQHPRALHHQSPSAPLRA
jgi:hypothetical protein